MFLFQFNNHMENAQTYNYGIFIKNEYFILVLSLFSAEN